MAFRKDKGQQQPTAPTAMTHADITKAVQAALGPIVDATAANTTGINQLRESRRTEVKARRAGDQRNHEDIQKLDKRHRNLQSRTDRHQARQDNNIAALDQRLAETYDRLVQLEQYVTNGTPLQTAAAFAGFNTDEIKALLGIQGDKRLSDADVVKYMADLLGKQGRRITESEKFIVQLFSRTRVLGDNGENFVALQEDVDELKRASKPINLLVPLIIGGVVGLIAGLLWQWHDFTGSASFESAKFKDSIGGDATVDFVNGTATSAADDIWVAVLVGLAAGAFAFAMALLVQLVVSSFERKPKAKPQAKSPEPTGSKPNGSNGTGFIAGQMSKQNPNHPASQAKGSGGAPTRVDSVNLYTQPGVSAPAGPATKKA